MVLHNLRCTSMIPILVMTFPLQQVSSDSIPVLDMSLSRGDAADVLFDAASTYGFFYLENHGVSAAESKQALDHDKSLFDWYSLAEVNLSTNHTHWGYVEYQNEELDPDLQTEGDTKKGFYIAQNDSVSQRSNQWPSIPGWKDNVQKYMDKMKDLSTALAQLIALSLNLSSNYFESEGIRDEGQEVLYLLHYPPHKSDPGKGKFGAGAHTDYDLFTILLTDSNSGLEIWNKGEWIKVEYRENAFIVNIADTLQLWTNGMFKSARHRVILNGERDRYSMPYFVGANRNLEIDCLPNTVVEGHEIFGQCNHEPFLSGDYLEYKLQSTHAEYTVPGTCDKKEDL